MLAARLSRAPSFLELLLAFYRVSRDSSQSNFVLCPKQGNKLVGVVLNRVCILGFFRPKQAGGGGGGLRLIPKYPAQILVEYPPSPPPPGVTGKFKSNVTNRLK